jgi:hypothetical protein
MSIQFFDVTVFQVNAGKRFAPIKKCNICMTVKLLVILQLCRCHASEQIHYSPGAEYFSSMTQFAIRY